MELVGKRMHISEKEYIILEKCYILNEYGGIKCNKTVSQVIIHF
jgi:hypothetical protein